MKWDKKRDIIIISFFFFFERLFTSLMGYNQMLTIDYSEPIFVVSILLAINLQDLKKKKNLRVNLLA